MKAKIAGTCVLGAIAFTAFVGAAQAQIFPTRPISVIAPWSTHDATDMQLDPILVSDSDKERSTDFDEHDRTLGTLIFRDEFQRFHIWDGRDGWNVTGGPQWGGPLSVAPPSIGRAAEKYSQAPDAADVVALGLRPEIADRHVFDHAPA